MRRKGFKTKLKEAQSQIRVAIGLLTEVVDDEDADCKARKRAETIITAIKTDEEEIGLILRELKKLNK